jgi:hypothetical protein
MSKCESRTKLAAREYRAAMREKQTADCYLSNGDAYEAHIHRLISGEHEGKADALMQLEKPPEIQLGEVVPETIDDHSWRIRNTLKSPDGAALDASVERTDLLLMASADLAGLGIDAAASIGASNSLEKMLAHQMALAHAASFKLMDKALGHRDSVEQARLTNAATRLMATFQQGLLTLQKLRTGGNQTVTVQHVHVGEGGQAVIGNVQAGGGMAGGDGKR